MKKRIGIALVLGGMLGAATMLTSTAQAMPPSLSGQLGDAAANLSPIEQAQFLFGGRNYCFYLDGWHGPGWYWCGYRYRRGFGWGGPEGWHGWGRGGPPRGGVMHGGPPRGGMMHGPGPGRGGPPHGGMMGGPGRGGPPHGGMTGGPGRGGPPHGGPGGHGGHHH